MDKPIASLSCDQKILLAPCAAVISATPRRPGLGRNLVTIHVEDSLAVGRNMSGTQIRIVGIDAIQRNVEPALRALDGRGARL